MTDARTLHNHHVAVLATDGFEESELLQPKQALLDAGAKVKIVSLHEGPIKGWREGNWAGGVQVDLLVKNANPEDFDALLLPGGVMNPDKLRMDKNAVAFVKHFADSGKPIAAICHGPWTLIETGFVRGHTLTSWPSLKSDLLNAGADWVDKEVVVDHGLVTSRKPADIPVFNAKMIEEFAEGKHRRSRVA